MQNEIEKWLMQKITDKVQFEKDCCKNLESAIRDYQRQIESWKIDSKNRKENVVKLESEQEKVKEKALERSKIIFNSLAKHKEFDSIRVSGKNLFVMTKVIFTDIRKEEGSKVMKRTCLGAFLIIIPGSKSPSDVKISNQLFNNNSGDYSHWGIHDPRVCWGEWEKDVLGCLIKDDIYGLFDGIIQYLKESQLDGAAYKRSQNWRNDRYLIQAAQTFNTGDYVLCTKKEQDGVEMLGRIGTITSFSQVSTIAEWKRKSGIFGWMMPTESLVKITKKQYEAAERYKFTMKQPNKVKFFDKLPNGMTLKESLDEYEKAKKLTLTPIKNKAEKKRKLKFQIGDAVRLVKTKYYAQPQIPVELLSHGNIPNLNTTGIVKNIYNEFFIVDYLDSAGGRTMLGFHEDALELIKPA